MNYIDEPCRRAGGRLFDTWTARIGDERVAIKIFVTRVGRTDYVFSAEFPGTRYKGDRLQATTLAALSDTVNAIIDADVSKTWRKSILVQATSYHNGRVTPDGPGCHDLAIDWELVRARSIGKRMYYLREDGTIPCAMRNASGDAQLIEWTPEREAVLRALGSAIHGAQSRLSALMAEATGLEKALDSAVGTSGQKLLTGGITEG